MDAGTNMLLFPLPSSSLLHNGSPLTKPKRNKQFLLLKKRKLAATMWGTAASRRLSLKTPSCLMVESVHQGTRCPQQQFLFAWQRKSQGQLCIHAARRTTHLAWFSLNIRRAHKAWGTATASPLASGNPSGLSVEKPLLERDGERMLLLCDGSRGLADVRDVQPLLQHRCLKPHSSPQGQERALT